MKVAIIKYNGGNIRSVILCLKRLGVDATLTDEAEELLRADRVIFPGVGEAGTTMKYLSERNLDKLITKLRQPVLGICLGMQLMCSHSEEGNTKCLGIFPEKVKLFRFNENELKVPHTGWNTLKLTSTELFGGIQVNEFMYFIHSYYVEAGVNTIAQTFYGVEFSSAIRHDNFYGVQFHPEKSAKWGENVISNFLNIC